MSRFTEVAAIYPDAPSSPYEHVTEPIGHAFSMKTLALRIQRADAIRSQAGALAAHGSLYPGWCPDAITHGGIGKPPPCWPFTWFAGGLSRAAIPRWPSCHSGAD